MSHKPPFVVCVSMLFSVRISQIFIVLSLEQETTRLFYIGCCLAQFTDSE